jgi:hypothetical protein
MVNFLFIRTFYYCFHIRSGSLVNLVKRITSRTGLDGFKIVACNVQESNWSSVGDILDHFLRIFPVMSPAIVLSI